jgi:hypothetical protein
VHYRILADVIVALHLGFILFAVLGGTLLIRSRRWAWVHLPAVAWAALVELRGWVCPLTPLENWLRQAGGAAGYGTGFVDHYLVPIVYPTLLTRELQILLGVLLLMLNLGIYAWAWRARSP